MLHVSTSDSVFTLVMEAMQSADGWEQLPVVPAGPATTATIDWIAAFHAAFLPAQPTGGGGLDPRPSGMWEYGTHSALQRRPPAELERLPQIMQVRRPNEYVGLVRV